MGTRRMSALRFDSARPAHMCTQTGCLGQSTATGTACDVGRCLPHSAPPSLSETPRAHKLCPCMRHYDCIHSHTGQNFQESCLGHTRKTRAAASLEPASIQVIYERAAWLWLHPRQSCRSCHDGMYLPSTELMSLQYACLTVVSAFWCICETEHVASESIAPRPCCFAVLRKCPPKAIGCSGAVVPSSRCYWSLGEVLHICPKGRNDKPLDKLVEPCPAQLKRLRNAVLVHATQYIACSSATSSRAAMYCNDGCLRVQRIAGRCCLLK